MIASLRLPALASLPMLLGASLTSLAATPSIDLAQCAAIAVDAARLACYDQLAGRTAAAPALAERRSSPAAPAVSAAASASAAPAAGAAAASDAQSFGYSSIQKHETPAEVKSLEALVTAVSTDAGGHLRVVLDNEQTWVFTESEDDSRLRAGDKVTIKRASLGSFLMLTPSRHSFRVHRTQ